MNKGYEDELVIGGERAPLSNRAKESADDLPKVAANRVKTIKELIAECEDVSALVAVLHAMDKLKYNFVGSRGYVYMARAMMTELLTYHLKCDPCVFTRCCGLRDKAIELVGAGSEQD